MLIQSRGILPVRPYGFTLEGSVHPVEGEQVDVPGARWVQTDQLQFEGTIRGPDSKGRFIERAVTFSLPEVDKRGFYKVGPTSYVICCVGKQDPWSSSGSGWYFLRKGEVLVRILEKALARALAPLYFQGDLNLVQVDTSIQSVLVGHPWVRQVPLGKEDAFADTVLMDFGNDHRHPSAFEFPEELIGCLDPSSTSAGERINQVYQLCKGAVIRNGRIIPSADTTLCGYTDSFAIAPDLAPRRRYLLRLAGLNSMELMSPTPDFFGRETAVQSKTFLTAIVDLGVYTFEDAIAIRHDLNFDATELSNVTAWSEQPFTIHSEKGAMLKKGDCLASTPKGLVASSVFDDLPNQVVVPRFAHPTFLEDVQVMHGWFLGQRMYRTIFRLRSYSSIMEGDKLSNFSGAKGVATVLQDTPCLPDGTPIDICVSASGIARRGAIQLIYEMMLRAHRDAGNQDNPDFKTLALASKNRSVVNWRGRKLNVFAGQAAWLRLNKLSAKAASAVGRERPTQPNGLPIDRASVGGQMLDISKSVVLMNSGLHRTLKDALSDQAGVKKVRDIIRAIEGPACAYRNKVVQLPVPQGQEAEAPAVERQVA